MNIGPQQVIQLIQITEKQKERIEQLEKDRVRFVSVMAEVKLAHQQELQQIKQKVQAQNILNMLFNPAPREPGNAIEETQNLEQSGEVDLRVSGELGASQQSVSQEELAQRMEELIRQKQRDDQSLRELNDRLSRAITDLKEAHERSEALEREVHKLQEERLKEQSPFTRISGNMYLSDLEMKVEAPSSVPAPIARQDSDLEEKADLREKLVKLADKDKQLQEELAIQLKQINSLEGSLKSLRSQKDAEILRLRRQLEEAEQKYTREITSIRQAVEQSRHSTSQEAEGVRSIIHREEQRDTNIKTHLRQVFENRKDKIARKERENTYSDLSNLLCRVVRDLEAEYQPRESSSK